jgi:uncharacterized protein (TIGR02246 family)
MELEHLFQTYKTSVFNKDLEAHLSIFDDDILVFDMWSTWVYEGIGAWRDVTSEWFSSLHDERVLVDFTEVSQHSADDLAFATACVTFAAQDLQGKTLRSLQERLTWVARKKNGQWKIIHAHTSGPVDHATLKVILKRT